MTETAPPPCLAVVGLGPGSTALLPPMAVDALARSEVITGYSLYVDLIPQELRQGRTIIATGMMAEVKRCEAALDAALAGKSTAVVCSGDPGVYAMAGLILEIMHSRGISLSDLDLCVVPGIPALCAAAALLGAPLMHDFAAVSLSDLLTPWALIEKRLFHALAGDFVLAIYNPRSRSRQDHLARALELAGEHRAPETPVGFVRNAYRPDQSVAVAALRDFDPGIVDMLCIVIIGNSSSAVLPAEGELPLDWNAGARIYTPRGYKDKYGKL